MTSLFSMSVLSIIYSLVVLAIIDAFLFNINQYVKTRDAIKLS